jgi:hypothetical protein
MTKRRKASGRKRSKEITWEIEEGSYFVDGTLSKAFTIHTSFRSEKLARKSWADDAGRQCLHPHYSALKTVTQTVEGPVNTKWIESRFSFGPFTQWQLDVFRAR